MINCPTCQTENPAGARFCLNCGAALALRCPNCQAELPDGARFCTSCGTAVQDKTPADQARHSRLAAGAPSPLVEKVRAAGPPAGERRLVTILYADVVDSTGLAEQVGAETWMAIMTGAFDRITPAIYRYEGTIARLLGDSLWAFFGAPVAHEDDPVRAVRAALDLLDAAREHAAEVRREYGIEFAMRACLNTGQVVLGPVGDDLRYEYTATGGAVNLAARLKFAAPPMTVLITEHTHRFVAPAFEWEGLGTIDVAGRDEPLHIYRAVAAKVRPGRMRGLAGLESPMVGRDAELATLLQLCDAVRAGLGRAVLVTGEPGLGKTRLIQEWKAAVAGMEHGSPPQWAEGYCLSYGQDLAYHLLVDLLRSILGVSWAADEPETHAALLALMEELFGRSTSLTELAEATRAEPAEATRAELAEAMDVYPYLGHLLSLRLEGEALDRVRALDPQALQTQYLFAIRKLLQKLATRHPLLLVLEDLHWADPSSIELLIRLLPLTSGTPVLFCLVTRPDRDAPGWRLVGAARETMGGSLTEIPLDALSEADSRQLVSNLLEIDALPTGMRAHILKKAEGNPLFVEEVIRMLIDRGAIVQDDGDWVAGAGIESVEIPDNLQGLLLARIDRLPEDVKQTLRVAAVIGRQFPVKVLEQVLERESSA